MGQDTFQFRPIMASFSPRRRIELTRAPSPSLLCRQQVAELATYISSLRGDEEQALVKQVVPVIEAKNITEATNILVKESKTLLEAPEKGTYSSDLRKNWLRKSIWEKQRMSQGSHPC